MKLKKAVTFTFFMSFIISCMLSFNSFAHSGNTDEYGGHKDRNNRSGFGLYHYHCGGYPAHLHPNGNCPYDETAQNDVIYPIAISLDKKEIKLEIDETAQLKARIEPENAIYDDIYWSVSDSTVVTVSEDGFLQPKSEGGTLVSAATVNGHTASVWVSVYRIYEEHVSLKIETEPVITIFGREFFDLNQDLKITTQVFPENATYNEVNISINNGILIDKETIRATGTGSMTIKASTNGGHFSMRTIDIIDYFAVICKFIISAVFFLISTGVLIFIFIKRRNIKKGG